MPPQINLFRRTRFAPLLAELSFDCLDAGSRDGFDPDLLPIAFAVNAFGFEPHAEECARLVAAAAKDPGPWRSLHYFALALSGTGGRRTLHVPLNTHAASLLEHNAALGRAFRKEALFTIDRTFAIDTVTLDEAVRVSGALKAPDYLKLDIEGAELEVLESGPQTLGQLLAIKTEVSFMHFRRAQPLAADIDAFLRSRGFLLMDLTGTMRWRRKGTFSHPRVSGEGVPYSRGQLAHGDYLYFRDPGTLDARDPDGLTRLLKAGCLAMAWGFFDHASDIFARPEVEAHLASRYGIRADEALREASMVFGSGAWAGELIRHLRGLVPLLRSVGPVLRGKVGRP